jgi:hypothetical protein
MPSPDKQLSAEQSRQVAELVREELRRRRISRQTLAEQAKLSLSTLEKVLAAAGLYARHHGAAGAGARRLLAQKGPRGSARLPPAMARFRPTGSAPIPPRRRPWLEGTYITVRPSFGDKEAI